MAEKKRYYWIRLKDSFMTGDEIDFLMSQKNGAEYVVLYQMLCLMTCNTAGKLQKELGEVIIKYDVDRIQRDCKYFEFDTIVIALELYKKLGLIYEDTDGALQIANYSEMVGSSTNWADQKRAQRDRKQLPEGGHCPPQIPPLCPPDKDKEKEIDKEIEKEIEKEGIPPISPKGEKGKKKAAPAVPDFSQTDFTPAMIAKVNEWLDYKAEKRQQYKPTGLKSLITQIEKQAHQHGEAAVMQLIDDCMAANYQGIIWDKLGRQSNGPRQAESGNPFLDMLRGGEDQ